MGASPLLMWPGGNGQALERARGAAASHGAKGHAQWQAVISRPIAPEMIHNVPNGAHKLAMMAMNMVWDRVTSGSRHVIHSAPPPVTASGLACGASGVSICVAYGLSAWAVPGQTFYSRGRSCRAPASTCALARPTGAPHQWLAAPQTPSVGARRSSFMGPAADSDADTRWCRVLLAGCWRGCQGEQALWVPRAVGARHPKSTPSRAPGGHKRGTQASLGVSICGPVCLGSHFYAAPAAESDILALAGSCGCARAPLQQPKRTSARLRREDTRFDHGF